MFDNIEFKMVFIYTYALAKASLGELCINGQLIEALLNLWPTFSACFGHELEATKGARSTGFAAVNPIESFVRCHALQFPRHLSEAVGERRRPHLEAAGEERRLGVAAADVLNRNGVVADVQRDLHHLLVVLEPRAFVLAAVPFVGRHQRPAQRPAKRPA